jgi:hypothetical protein
VEAHEYPHHINTPFLNLHSYHRTSQQHAQLIVDPIHQLTHLQRLAARPHQQLQEVQRSVGSPAQQRLLQEGARLQGSKCYNRGKR